MSINPGIGVPDDVQASVQIANDLGEQVVNLVPTHGGTAPQPPERRQRAGRSPTRCPADVGAVVASATRLLQAIPANDLNKLIGELATALQGQAGNLRTLIDAGTTFSKEFVAYQQQFTELLANAPPSLDAVTAVAPELRQDLANTAALVQVLAEQKQSGLHNLLANGSSAFAQINNLVTSQSANLGCVLHDTADILTNLAQPANLTNLSQGLAYNTYFFGAVDKIAVAGNAKAPDEEQPARPEPGLPAHPPAAAADPLRAGRVLRDGQPDPRHPARRRLHHRLRPGRRAGDPGRLHPGRRRPRWSSRARRTSDVELNAGPTVPVSNASYRVPRSSAGLLLALGGLVVPVLFLAWGARPSRRRTRRRDRALTRGQPARTEADAAPRRHGRISEGDAREEPFVERGVKVVGACPTTSDDDTKDETVDDEAASDSPPPPPTKRRPGGARRPGPSRQAFRVVARRRRARPARHHRLRRPLRHQELGPGPGPRRPQRLADVPDRLLQLHAQDGGLGLQRHHRHGDRPVLVAGQPVLQLDHPQGARAGGGLVARAASATWPCSRRATRRGRRRSTPSSTRPTPTTRSTALGSDVVRLTADLQQVNGVWKISNVTVLEGATPGQRQHRQLRLGLGRLLGPRP